MIIQYMYIIYNDQIRVIIISVSNIYHFYVRNLWTLNSYLKIYHKLLYLEPVAHSCNPSYLGGRDQENQGSKPVPGIRNLHWWFMPVILATQEAQIRRIEVRSQPQTNSLRPYLEKTHHKKGLVEWLKKGLVVECLPSKCEALSLNLSTINK
jgi:hypothetical protein